MKKLLVTLILLVATITSYSQIPKQQSLSDFSTWSISPYFAFTYENTDIEENDPFYKRTSLNRGFGFELSNQLTHFTSWQLNYFKSNLETESNLYNFNTDLNQVDVRFRFNLTNGAVFRKWQSTQLYAFAGYGILFYDATRSSTITGLTEMQSTNTTSVVPIGAGVRYRLGNRTSLSFDFTYNQTNTDNLDAWVNGLTSKDGYSKASFTFTYNLGKKKILEWDQPWAYLVPDVVHDTTVVIQKLEYIAPKVEPVKLDSTVIYYLAKNYQIEEYYLDELDHVLSRARDENRGIEIMAYCDSSGTESANYDLVTLRAEKVAQYAKQFIPEARISIFRYDESWAVYAPEARNRKVVVKLTQW